MTKTTLFCYNLGESDPSTRTMIHRALYGYKDISNYGKYSYKRKGILQEIKHKKFVGSAIVVKKEDVPKLIKIFKKYSVDFYTFDLK